MSLDRSLRQKNALVRHRNVLRRDERMTALKEQEKWEEGRSLFGLPKVAHRKVATKKAAKAAAEAVPGAEGVAAVPGAEGAAAAPAAGAAAPAGKAGAKGAAPAGKAGAKGAAPATAAGKKEEKPAGKGKK
jgi:small basic protein (TIGR04137 family)